jgi:glycosyltransferase involved in cell wall biosynthesis
MKSKKTGILFVINDFNIGGAEQFILRLGKALSSNYEVYVMDIYPQNSKDSFKQQFVENGFSYINKYQSLSPIRNYIYWKINALYDLFEKKGKYNHLKKKYQERQLIKTIKKYKIRLLHSHHYSSDCFVQTHIKKLALPWVITMHGGYNKKVYLSLNEHAKIDFLNNVKQNMLSCSAVTYVANVNTELLKEYDIVPPKIKKIALGLDTVYLEKDLLYKNGDIFTYSMVARADADKGWEILIDAFKILNKKYPNTVLICIGPMEGIIKELYEKNVNNKAIIFTGYTPDPSHFVKKSNVGVLPTFFDGESTPYSIIEYFSCGKPVIATNKGEIVDMLDVNNKLAGTIIKVNVITGKPDIQDLLKAMEDIFLDESLYKETKELAVLAFKKFSMELCKKNYISLYNDLLCVE